MEDSQLFQALKNYPKLQDTLDSIENLEDDAKSDSSECGSPTDRGIPSYYLAEELDDCEEEGSEEEDDDFPAEVPDPPNVDMLESIMEDEIDDTTYQVHFEAKKSWKPIVEDKDSGKEKFVLSVPQNLSALQLLQWESGIHALAEKLGGCRLIKISTRGTRDGIEFTVRETPCVSPAPNPVPSTSRSSSISSSVSTRHTDSPGSRSNTSLGIPDVPTNLIDTGAIDKEFILSPVAPTDPPYKNTLRSLFGSGESFEQYNKTGIYSLKELVIAGLKRKGIYNRIRIRCNLEPQFV
uniref:Phosphoprotein n=2 Tax=Chandipura virus TaxID=11272 RepID=A0A7H1HCD2_9RHAB|nr:phosphoprotein [Chandipura virus]QNS83627.1 phosphoprotein [Chandipura virus]QNS83632.1 phosphoprotein [Chandipura virus]QNS83637.1 phosphoprotein [Chandipura virus]QNS83647.1 phosphoprotein [Chandipura virus]